MAIYLDIDWTAEKRRMQEAARLLTVLQNDWARADRDGATLVGPFGRMIVDHIRGQYNSGPAKKVHVTSTEGAVSEVDSGRFTRWDQLVTAADPGVNPWPEVTEQRALLYRTPLKISGDIVSPAWTFLRQNSSFDAMMLKKQELVLGCGSAMIRPTLWPVPEMDGIYYPPGLEVVPPDRCFAIPDPANRRRAIVVGEKQGDHWVIWDVSRPRRPQWGWWRNPTDFFQGRPPIRVQAGESYPWIVDGSPIMPAVCQQADAAPDGLLPYHTGVTQEVLDIIGKGAWCEFIAHMGGLQRVVLLTEAEPQGLHQLTNDPTTIGSIYGGGTAQIATLPDSSASAKINRQMFRDRVEEWAKGIDPSFSVSVSESAKSGTALLIEMTGRKQLAEEMKTRAEWVDTEIIGALVATWNYLVASEQLPLEMVGGEIRWNPLVVPEARAEYLIPTAKPTLDYPLSWNEVERKAKRAEIQAAVDAGQESPCALWLLDHDLEDDRPDGPNWLRADTEIRANLADATAYAALGYGLRWQDRVALAGATPEDETALYIPPADVADTAAEGLRLRDAFPHRATDGKKPEGKRLMAKAKGLRNQTPMLAGEVRALNVWLRAHEGDAGLDADVGEWGNAADPSGRWIDYLTQGGDPGLAWTNATLAPPAPTEEVPSE